MKKIPLSRVLGVVFLSILLISQGAGLTWARGEILGIHILSPAEIGKADALLENGDDKDKFVTVPITVADAAKPDEWQRFLDESHRLKIRPILRFATVFENGNWKIPTHTEIVRLTAMLTSLEWRRPELTVILFNEPNQAKEWGGTIDPPGFERLSSFAAQWLATEPKDYTILPAAMDLAADGNNGTMEAFGYWRAVLAQNPQFFDQFEGWNSHSYPNPGFSSSPTRTDQRSLRGYTYELEFIKSYTTKTFPVYITETGWNQNVLTDKKLRTYFEQAYETIWAKDPRIVAVTPFLLQGAPGTFAPFSFLDKDGKPTIAYDIYKNILNAKK